MAIEDGTVGDLGVIVLDELHMVDDDHRGYQMCVTSEHSFPSSVDLHRVARYCINRKPS